MPKLTIENLKYFLNKEKGWLYSEFNEVISKNDGNLIQKFDWNVWDLATGGFVRTGSRTSLNLESTSDQTPVQVEVNYYIDLKSEEVTLGQKNELIVYRVFSDLDTAQNPITIHYLHSRKEGTYQVVSDNEVVASDWLLVSDYLKTVYRTKGLVTPVVQAVLDCWSYVDSKQQYLLQEWMAFSYHLNEAGDFAIVRMPKYSIWDLTNGGTLGEEVIADLRATTSWKKVLTKSKTYYQNSFKSFPKLLVQEIHEMREEALNVQFYNLRQSDLDTQVPLAIHSYLETENGFSPIPYDQINLEEWESEVAYLSRRINSRKNREEQV